METRTQANVERKINSEVIGKRLNLERPEYLNPTSKVDLSKVMLPRGYAENVLSLIRRAFYEGEVDYHKPEFIAVSLSGGIDSSTALTAGVRAIGRDKVRAVIMEHNYMTPGEREDRESAEIIVDHLGVKKDVLDVTKSVEALWDLSDKRDYGEFAKHVLRAEALMRARSAAMQTYSAIELAQTIDTTNLTELAIGRITYGAFIGMIDIMDDLYKCEVHKLAEELGVPKNIREQPKRMNEITSTFEQFYGADFDYLDPVVHRYLLGKTAEQTVKELGHSEKWIKDLFKTMRSTEFRLNNVGSSHKIGEFCEHPEKDAKWVRGLRGDLEDRLYKEPLLQELEKNRRAYL